MKIKNILPLLVFYLATRLYHLTLLPIFTDESIYIYWAKVISTTHSQWFLSLTDGKPPLLVWGITAMLSVLPQQAYLLAGRLPVVLAGGLAVVGIYKLAKLVSKSELVAIVSAGLYIISPFYIVYDRMALFDSLLSSMLVWTTYFSIKAAQTSSLRSAILAGIFLGLAFLSKPTAVVYLGLIPLIFLVFNRRRLLVSLIPIAIGEAINNLQRLSHVYFLMDLKNQQFQQPLAKLIAEPFALAPGNLQGLLNWILAYYTWSVFLAGLIAFGFLLWKHRQIGIIFLAFWTVPILAFSFVGREIFPRYILFITPYFLIPIAWLFAKRPWLLLFVVLPQLWFSFLLLTDPPKAPLPVTDYNQYISEHPSGYGLNSIFAFLHEEASKGPVILVTQGTFGLYPYAFSLEFWGDPNLTIVPRWPLSSIDNGIQELRSQGKVYVLLKEFDSVPSDWPVKLVLRSEKPGGKYPILLTTLR